MDTAPAIRIKHTSIFVIIIQHFVINALFKQYVVKLFYKLKQVHDKMIDEIIITTNRNSAKAQTHLLTMSQWVTNF